MARESNALCCKGIGTIINDFITDFEAKGHKFFEGKVSRETVCYASTCRSNEQGHCVVVRAESDNIFSIDKEGRCENFFTRK